MTRIRKLMLEELQRRNYSSETIRTYISAVKHYAEYFKQSPEKLGPEHIRQYQLHLFERKLAAHTVKVQSSALRFLYIHTLRRPYMLEHIPTPKTPVKLPNILSREEVAQLIEGAPNLMYRAIIMTLYSTGMRRSEACQLQVSDIDSGRNVIHIRGGKRRRDRDVPLEPEAARHSPRVLALDEAKNLAVPRIRERLASGHSNHRQSHLARLQGGCKECGHPEASDAAPAPPQLRHPPAGSRR